MLENDFSTKRITLTVRRYGIIITVKIITIIIIFD